MIIDREKINPQNGSTEVELEGWEDNPTVVALAKEMRSDVALYSHRVFHLTEQRSLTAVKKQFEKKRVKEDADVEMKDNTSAGPSIQSLVDKAVSSQLKKILPKAGKGKGKVNDFSNYSFTISDINFFTEIHQKRQGQSRRPQASSAQTRASSSQSNESGREICQKQRERQGEGFETQGQG